MRDMGAGVVQMCGAGVRDPHAGARTDGVGQRDMGGRERSSCGTAPSQVSFVGLLCRFFPHLE